MKNLREKVVLITGGASGVGLGIAQAFLEQSCRVVIADINKDHIYEAQTVLQQSGDSNVEFVALDVTDDDSWATTVESVWASHDGIDILINNAGISQGVTPGGCQAQAWEIPTKTRDTLLDVNVAGVMRGVQHVVPRMIERGAGGHVVTTASLSGLYAVPGISLYSASKFAVVGYSEALAGELDSYDIGVSILCPGSVKSKLKASAAGRIADETGARLDDYQKDLQEALSEKMDPVSVGRAVVSSVQKNELYVITHPAHKNAVQSRHNLVEQSFKEPAEPGYIEPQQSISSAQNPAYQRTCDTAQRALIVTRGSVSSEYEDEFNRWFDYEHLPERAACTGFLSARRFKTVEGESEYLAMYEIETLDVLESAEYQAMRDKSVWQEEVSGYVNNASRQVYVEITKEIDPSERIYADREKAADSMR